MPNIDCENKKILKKISVNKIIVKKIIANKIIVKNTIANSKIVITIIVRKIKKDEEEVRAKFLLIVKKR